MNIRYRLSRLGCIAVLGALTLAACGETADKETGEAEMKLVFQVNKVTMKRLAKTPPALVLDVEGMAPTAGWENVSLEPLVIEDDILTYRLMGTPPEGMAAQVLTPVQASRLVDPLPETVTRIRVTASDNEIIEPVPTEPEQ